MGEEEADGVDGCGGVGYYGGLWACGAGYVVLELDGSSFSAGIEGKWVDEVVEEAAGNVV